MRLYYLDSLRSMLVLLGIFYHVSLMYLPTSDGQSVWMVHSGFESTAFEWMGILIHNFRMPAFFILSGFFMELILSKKENYSLLKVIKKRFVQLMVPCIFVGIVINSYVYTHTNFGTVNDLSSLSFWLGGSWIMHTWFIVNLFVYCCIYVLIRPLFQNIIRTFSWVNPFMWSLLIPLTVMLTMRIGWKLNDSPFGLYWLMFDLERLMDYIAYFFLGAILSIIPSALNLLKKFYSVYCIGLVFSVTVLVQMDSKAEGYRRVSV